VAVFSYQATTLEGVLVEGVVEAPDEKVAIERLRDTGVIPLRLTAPKGGIAKRFSARPSRTGLLTFTTELSALLAAGLPLDRGLNILTDISEGKEMKAVVQAILKSIREGSSFSDALQKHPRVFPRLYVSMVRAGESGGVLDVVLDKLNEFLESAKELKDSVMSAMIYPTILAVTGGISIIILLTFVIPKFSVIFDQMGGALPLPTKIVLAVGDGLRSYWWLAAGIGFGLAALFKWYVRTEKGSYRWDAVKLKLLGDIVAKLETARFCRTLGTLLKSGVPFLQALGNAKDVVTNKVIASSIDVVAGAVKEGKGMAGPLGEAGTFPPLALSMIKVGEETGQLDTMLLKVAGTYEKGLRDTVKRFMSLLEPVMILSMGLVIGFIVISMLIAIFSITELPF
jgi:general secretion pathway protein F